MPNQIEQLQNELNALIEEKAKIEQDLDISQARLKELNGGIFGSSPGLIAEKRRELRNAHFPIYDDPDLYTIRRIIEITDKWIILRYDSNSDKSITRYKKDTGRIERARDDRFSIDFEKAIQIWEEHLKTGEQK